MNLTIIFYFADGSTYCIRKPSQNFWDIFVPQFTIQEIMGWDLRPAEFDEITQLNVILNKVGVHRTWRACQTAGLLTGQEYRVPVSMIHV